MGPGAASQHNLPLKVIFFPYCSVPKLEAPFLSMQGGSKENVHVFINRSSVLNLLPFYTKCLRLQNCIKGHCVCCASIPVAL